jgi:plastocyanin domain-containing protein
MKTLLLAVPAALALAAAPALTLACDCGKGAEKAAPTATTPAAPADAGSPAPAKGAQVIQLTVTEDGFVPAAIKAKAGQPVVLQVTRTTDRTCATEIVMKDFGVNQKLPLGKAVSVTFTPKGKGSFRYACAMDMITGTLTVE